MRRFVLLAFLLACSSDPAQPVAADPACAHGLVTSCPCPGGDGAQTCLDDGSGFGSCVCPAAQAGAGGSSGAGGDASAGAGGEAPSAGSGGEAGSTAGAGGNTAGAAGEAGEGGDGGAAGEPGGGGQAGGPSPSCSHSACETGGPIKASCSACAAAVCAASDACCSSDWTQACADLATAEPTCACGTGGSGGAPGSCVVPPTPSCDCKDGRSSTARGTWTCFDPDGEPTCDCRYADPHESVGHSTSPCDMVTADDYAFRTACDGDELYPRCRFIGSPGGDWIPKYCATPLGGPTVAVAFGKATEVLCCKPLPPAE